MQLCQRLLAGGGRSPDELSSFQVFGHRGVSVMAAQHLVDVFQRPALRLRQRGGGEERPSEVDGGEQGEGRPVAERRRQRPVEVRAGGARREPDEAARRRGDAAHRLRKQLGVEDTRHARPAERIDRHEDGHADDRQTRAARHLHAAAVQRRHLIRPRRRRRRHVTGNR